MPLVAAILAVIMFAGCGRKAETAPSAEKTANQTTNVQAEGDRNPTAEELGRAETLDLEFMVGGTMETALTTLYIGQGYSIYIPDEGWRLEKDMDDGIPEETWESTVNNDVEFAVSHYSGVSASEAKQRIVADRDYVFEDLVGGKFGDPLTGVDEDGDYLSLMSVEGNGVTYILSWEYPAGTKEGFGLRMEQIMNTFQLIK